MSEGRNFQIELSVPKTISFARNKGKVSFCTAKKRRKHLNDNRNNIH